MAERTLLKSAYLKKIYIGRDITDGNVRVSLSHVRHFAIVLQYKRLNKYQLLDMDKQQQQQQQQHDTGELELFLVRLAGCTAAARSNA